MFNTASPQHLGTLVFIMLSYHGRRLECLKIYINMTSNTFINCHEQWAQWRRCLRSALSVLWLCVCMPSCFSHVHPFAILWIVSHQAPLSMIFSRQEYWSGLPFPSPGNLPNPRTKPTSLMSSALIGRFLTMSPSWGACCMIRMFNRQSS